MDKIGRNDPCPCGSGKKFKKCCGRSNHTSKESTPHINLSEMIKAIPDTIAMLKINEFTAHKCESRIHEMMADGNLCQALGWPDTKIKTFSQELLTFVTNEAEPFDFQIFPEEFYLKLLDKSKQAALRIYWNEIDQRLHWYRCNVVTQLSRRIRKAIDNFEDIIVSPLLARQILEIVLDSVSNQWAITTAFNVLRKEFLKEQCMRAPFVSCKSLENFAIALIVWPKRRLQMMEEFLGKEKTDWKARKYDPPETNPTTEQQFSVAKYVAKNYDDHPDFAKYQLLKSVELIWSSYKYLSGFVHSSPHLFPFDHQVLNYSDSDVSLSVKVAMVKVIEQCLKIFNILFLPEMFNLRFESLISNVGIPSHIIEKAPTMDISLSFVDDFMNRYKELVLMTAFGDIPIWKKGGGQFSKETEEIAKIYEALSEKQKVSIRELIHSFSRSGEGSKENTS